MLFNTIDFIIFLIIVVIIYYAIPQNRGRKIFLLLASYYFYACWNVAFLGLLLFDTIVAYSTGNMLARKQKRHSKKVLWTAIILILSPLFVFKYLNFFLSTVHDCLDAVGIAMQVPEFEMLLPIGISFYTFMSVGYVADVYLKKIDNESNILDFALFVGFFPQIASGPIGRAKSMLPQFKERHPFIFEDLAAGAKMMLWGFFMKLVVGDRAGIYVDTVFGNYANHNGGSLLLATFMYTVQIYCDFAGYSLIAIGSAKIMGYELMTNFCRPYFATSVADFWRRWHISLSTWFRDYVYIPCGGNRVGEIKRYRNLMITFLTSGLWHGAAYNFIVWGAYHGLAQVFGKMTSERKMSLWKVVGINPDGKVKRTVDILFTFAIVSYGWMIFYVSDFNSAIEITKGYFALGMPYVHQTTLFFFAIGFAILFIKDFKDEFMPDRHYLLDSRLTPIRYISFAFLTMLIVLIGVLDGGQFIYFKF